MKLEQRTREAIAKAMKILDWECDCYEWGTEEYEALMEIIADMEDLLH